MDSERHSPRTVLIVETSIEAALGLQDEVEQRGDLVFTAYSLERALLLARLLQLDDTIIDCRFHGMDAVVRILRARNIPYLLHAPQISYPAGALDGGHAPVAPRLQSAEHAPPSVEKRVQGIIQ